MTKSRMAVPEVAPMSVTGVQHLVERSYRESGEMQYIRELLVNALEAGATRVEFGPEWQAVEQHHVYRLMVADNGKGMRRDELLRFLNTFGGGGKNIGGAHENFGVGAKTSLLPWNHAGVVVMSWTIDEPSGSMVWLMHDAHTGQYGARKFKTEGGFHETVDIPPEWASIKPAWLRNGTVVVALGMTGKEDTFLGKGGKGDTKDISKYLNKRMWDMPPGVEVFVQELRYREKRNWPRSQNEACSSPTPAPGSKDVDRRWNRRRARGAAYFVTTVSGKSAEAMGQLGAQGSFLLADGSEVVWYLWDGVRPGIHAHAYEMGFIAAMYKGELYDVQQHPSQYRTFGVTQRKVRENLTVIIKPPAAGEGAYGVYPDTARNTLKLMGAKRSGDSLPWAEWGHEFAEAMPDEIRDALHKAGPDNSFGTVMDERWRDRLIDRFGSRWRSLRLLITAGGEKKAKPSPGLGTPPPPERDGENEPEAVESDDGEVETREPHERNEDGALGTHVLFGVPTRRGSTEASLVARKGGIPEWLWTDGSEIDEGCAAAWVPTAPEHPNGIVLMNRTFPTFIEVKRYWREQYPDHLSEEVERAVENVYGEAMVARIAHSEELVHAKTWGHERVERELRSPVSLTMASLGLVSEDQVISSRLGGLAGARRKKGAA